MTIPALERYQSLIKTLLGVAIVVLPLQYLWIRFFEASKAGEKTVFILTNWYELLLVVALPLFIWQLARKKLKLLWFDYAFLALVGLAALSFIWSPGGLSVDLIGARYAVGFLLFYFLARSAKVTLQDYQRPILNVFLAVVLVAGLQLLIWIVAGGDALRALNLGAQDYAGGLPRVYGSLIGPNQLATYLLLISLYLVARKIAPVWLLGLSLVLIVATFSRSALLGWLFGSLLLAYYHRSRINAGVLVAVVAIFGLIFYLGVARSDRFAAVFVTDRHSDQRLTALSETATRFRNSTVAQKLVGHGVATAGPSTFVTERIFVPENWFLQILHELGLVGLALLAAGVVGLMRHLASEERRIFWPIVLALAVNSFFLHTLSDNPTATITVFILLAAAVNQAQYTTTNNG